MENRKRKIHVDKKDYYTIPNILCYFRFLLVPLFVLSYLHGYYNETGNTALVYKWFGIGFVVLASITDFIDGKVARKYNLITELGKFLDPAADKVMQLAIAIVNCIIFYNMTSLPYMWILLGVFLVKEISQFICIYITYRHGQYINGAKWYGKISTFVFDVLMITVITIPLFCAVPNEETKLAMIIMTFASLFVLIFAWVMYLIECGKLWKSGVNNIPESLYKNDKDSNLKGDKND